MSHFSVMVFGPNVNEQLQPFHEFECTGINDQYVQDVDITEEVRETIGRRVEAGEDDALIDGLKWHGLEEKIIDDESKVDKAGAHTYGYAVVKDGVLIKAVKRTNPNKKWDWYQIGGRWSDFLMLKEGSTGGRGDRAWMIRDEPSKAGRADYAFKADIDFEGMRNEAAAEAAQRWDKANETIKGRKWVTWEEVRAMPDEGDDPWDARCKFYNGQEVLAELRRALDDSWDSMDEYLTPRDQYIQQARERSVTTFAVLKDGVWYEKGSMGWWGRVSDEQDQSGWDAEFNKLLDEVPDDMQITIVDCHI